MDVSTKSSTRDKIIITGENEKIFCSKVMRFGCKEANLNGALLNSIVLKKIVDLLENVLELECLYLGKVLI